MEHYEEAQVPIEQDALCTMQLPEKRRKNAMILRGSSSDMEALKALYQDKSDKSSSGFPSINEDC